MESAFVTGERLISKTMNPESYSCLGKAECSLHRHIFFLAPLLLLLSACASQPRSTETIWTTVADVYSKDKLNQSYNAQVLERFRSAGFSEQDIEQGRLIRVACGLGTDYTWGSYAYLPPGLKVKKEDVLQLRVDDPGTDDRMGMNPVLSQVEWFKWPGSLHAYRYISDWKEKNLFLNFERIPLEPEQQGRYVVSHGSYVIKCRQANEG